MRRTKRLTRPPGRMAALSGDLGRTTPGTPPAQALQGPPGGILHAGNTLTPGRKPPRSHSHSHPLRPSDGGQLSTQGAQAQTRLGPNPPAGLAHGLHPKHAQSTIHPHTRSCPKVAPSTGVGLELTPSPAGPPPPRGPSTPLPSSPVSPTGSALTHTWGFLTLNSHLDLPESHLTSTQV